MHKKVTVIGAGFVGATTSQRIVEMDLAEVVLLDIVEGLAQGKALDIMQSAPLKGFRLRILGTNTYQETQNSDIVVITAGVARKPGMSRDDLQATNAKIVREVVGKSIYYSPRAILIVVTNPLDVMSYLALKVSGFEPCRVIGMAGVLDASRYSYFIAEELGTSPKEVSTLVLGSHGDSMVCLPRYTTVKGIPLSQLLSREKIEAINERTKKAGAEIVSLLKAGSAYYAPSASIVEMVECVLYNENKILPCSVYLNGEYGLSGVYCGVPVRLSSKGVEEIIELKLSAEEKRLLTASAELVKENIKKLNLEIS